LHRKHGVGLTAASPEQEAGARIDSRTDGRHRQQHNLFAKGIHLETKITDYGCVDFLELGSSPPPLNPAIETNALLTRLISQLHNNSERSYGKR
jgi:hypothetical protein